MASTKVLRGAARVASFFLGVCLLIAGVWGGLFEQLGGYRSLFYVIAGSAFCIFGIQKNPPFP